MISHARRNCLPRHHFMAYDQVFQGAVMTMLDRMRRHMSWLKWSLGLVCLAFIIFYIPDFLRGSGADAAAGDTIAKVEGQDITAAEFRRTYQTQLQAYQTAYGANMSESLLKQLGIEQQILQQMVDERAALAEANRLGIKVSDDEVRQSIVSLPAFQENGSFIGEQRYQQHALTQRPSLRSDRRGAFRFFRDGRRREIRRRGTDLLDGDHRRQAVAVGPSLLVVAERGRPH